MSTKYKAIEANVAYFITITTVGWVDVFTRLRQKHMITNALQYCQEHKNLEIYAYCIMSSHIHLLCKAQEDELLSNVVRDFKTFTSKKIIEIIKQYPESRKEWLLTYFKNACSHLKRNQTYKVWQNGYHAEKVYSNKFIKQKIRYIHNNPVAEKIVENPEDYLFSSARNYAALDNELDITPLVIF